MSEFITIDSQILGRRVWDSAANICNLHISDKDASTARFHCISFNGNKPITTGQGGAILGTDENDEAIVRKLCNSGKTVLFGDYEYDTVGFNYAMSDLNAALGISQLTRIDAIRAKKNSIMNMYREAGLELLWSSWMAVCVLPDGINRDKFIIDMKKCDIEVKKFWKPLHLQASHSSCEKKQLPMATRMWQRLACLPCSLSLGREDQKKVIRCIEFLS
jgi:dTDP-4-amino-4,6-dideoxygalactose transaminase